jgi:integrase
LPGWTASALASRVSRRGSPSAALAGRWRRGMGTSTANNHIAAIKGFTKWLAEDRTNADPMRTLKRLNAEVDVRHARRSVTPEDFVRLVEAEANGDTFRGLTGEQRVRLHILATDTGFRAKELGHLTPTSFDLKRRPATVTVLAKYSKHRRKDEQKLREDIAEVVRNYCANLKGTDRLWPGTWWTSAAEMLRLDLEAAGVPSEVGEEFFDFHRTRKTFVSWLEQAGVRIKVAQVLARHSTITLNDGRLRPPRRGRRSGGPEAAARRAEVRTEHPNERASADGVTDSSRSRMVALRVALAGDEACRDNPGRLAPGLFHFALVLWRFGAV